MAELKIRDIVRKFELEDASMKGISRKIILDEKFPPMTTPQVEYLGYHIMKYCRGNLLLGMEPEEDTGNSHTKNLLRYLKPITGNLPYKVSPISIENYGKEIKRLKESILSGPLIVT